jgi:hypothetical protein
MAEFLNFTVDSLLNQQIELIGPGAVSLDSLWRVAGCPTEHSPRKWVVLAAPLIAGFVSYQAVLPGRPFPTPENPELVWVWQGGDSEPWRTGDIMTHELLARIYAAYLDTAL